MIRAIICFLILDFFMTTYSALAAITMTTDLAPLKHLLKQADQDTLVIFDVDHVLIMPTDESTRNRHPYRSQLWQDLEKRHSKEKMKILYGAVASKAKWRVIDPDIINVFTYLKQMGIPSMALTSLYTGKFGNIKKLEDWRIKHLQDMGFDFAQVTPIKEDIFVNELEEQDGLPMLKSGVILTAQIDKAKVLEYILRHKSYYPKTIIFIDDQLPNLESLEKMSTRLKIKFYGLHYTATSEMPVPVINEQIEKLRFQVLEQEHLWLNSSELAGRRQLVDHQ